jgi:2-dehydropantoate 2-reductase
MTFRKVCVVGPGALGGMLAVRLARAGYETCTLARPERAKRINANGITLRCEEGVFTEHVKASDDPAELGRQDMVIIVTKYTNLMEIAPKMAPLCGPSTPVVFWLNGVPWWFFQGWNGPKAGAKITCLDPDGTLERTFPLENIIWGAIEVGATELPDDTVLHKLANVVVFGRPDNSMRGMKEIGEVFTKAGYETEVTDKIRDALWSKLRVNMAVNPLSALTLADNHDMMADPLTQEVVMKILEESAAIGAALGLGAGVDYATMLRKNAPLMKGQRSSMAQDKLRNRPLEVDAIATAPVEIADLLGIPAPMTKAVLGLLRARLKAEAQFAKG